MSGEDNFIARWSRLKQRAADETKKKPRTGPEDRRISDAQAGQTSEVPAGPEHAHAKPAANEPPFDPASLPPIESIVAGTDIRAFLQKGVPAALTKAALRRAWTTDPAIRDFIEVAENQWDFTDPTAIPGFGPLENTDNLHQLVDQALGNLPEAPAATGPSEASRQTTAGAAVDAAPEMRPQLETSREGACNQATVDVAALQHPASTQQEGTAVGNAPRRRGHGRALPR